MRTSKPTPLLVCLALLGILACGLPEIPQAYQLTDSTSIAQTVQAAVQLTQSAIPAAAVTASNTPVNQATNTSTPDTPTLTLTATLSPTPLSTVTPLVPMISVSVPTNCRVGPGKVYEMVGALLVGETVQVYAHDPTNNYWYIRNPDDPSTFCWVWGEFGTLSGLYAALPVYTPPPTPTPTLTPTPNPGFNASFTGLDSCSPNWWAEIDLDNTGLVTFRSISITLRDTVTSGVVSDVSDGFTDNTGCSTTATRKSLLPDKSFTQSSPSFGYDPTGHKIKATITLCSDQGLNGVCVTDTFNFTP